MGPFEENTLTVLHKKFHNCPQGAIRPTALSFSPPLYYKEISHAEKRSGRQESVGKTAVDLV